MLQKDRFVLKLLTLCVIMRKQTLHALVFNLLFQLQFLESTIEDFEFREYTEFEFNSKKRKQHSKMFAKKHKHAKQTLLKKEKKTFIHKQRNLRC